MKSVIKPFLLLFSFALIEKVNCADNKDAKYKNEKRKIVESPEIQNIVQGIKNGNLPTKYSFKEGYIQLINKAGDYEISCMISIKGKHAGIIQCMKRNHLGGLPLPQGEVAKEILAVLREKLSDPDKKTFDNKRDGGYGYGAGPK